jgi:hypothetical protein
LELQEFPTTLPTKWSDKGFRFLNLNLMVTEQVGNLRLATREERASALRAFAAANPLLAQVSRLEARATSEAPEGCNKAGCVRKLRPGYTSLYKPS